MISRTSRAKICNFQKLRRIFRNYHVAILQTLGSMEELLEIDFFGAKAIKSKFDSMFLVETRFVFKF